MGADQTHADNHYELYFCDDTATTEIYTLSLHDALPISKFGRDRLDSTAALGAPPNTVRDATVGPNAANGTIDFRRRFTNNTGGAVTQLRFRITNVKDTSLPGAADLRALSSATFVVSVNDPATCGGPAPCNVTVVG